MALTSLDKENVNRLMKSLALDEIQGEKHIEVMRYNTTTCAKLQMLADQIEQLKVTANNLIETSIVNKTLHEAECNFAKVMGQVYHFYERENGAIYCSLIGPNEWKVYYKHYGSYMYDYDSEFKKVV